MKDITVTFPGGKRVDAHYDGRSVRTDQPVKEGGDGTAPEPFDLFFVSIATCVGIYVLQFCAVRQLNTEGLGVSLQSAQDPDQKRYGKVAVHIVLPDDFPERYRKPILRTADLCAVKKHILTPPEFDITLSQPLSKQERS